MKQLLVFSNVLLLLSCDAAVFMSPSESPVFSPSSEPSNNDCSTVVYGMFDCLSFLTSSRAIGFDLINNRALPIPSTCNIPIDPHCVSPSKPPTTRLSSG
ncbi:hypothetical protein HID58_034146 [Brassica napus]|uniref:Bifunctional inhibitor/plant lipid transfer protein/seed storage helical domain-containing protein n=1 Tax=Brassica napus TaxID=3708 RepID=A0ABQ8C2U9_BRANA|nr:hypothetical protein HID58_034146 [Brassica napus]